MAQVKFRKVNGIATSGLETGGIYFDKSTGIIHVATSATETDKFGVGVKDAKLENSILTITRWDNTEVTVDFSDIASASSVVAALALKADKTQVAADIAAAQAADKNELNTAIKAAKTVVNEKAEGHVTVTKSTGADGNDVYTVAENDIASAEALGELSTTVAGHTATINSILGNTDETDLNSIAELATWIEEHGTEAAEMAASIKANGEAIDAIEEDYLKSVIYYSTDDYVTVTIDNVANNEATFEVDDSAIASKFAELEGQINDAVAGSVTSFGGETGAITVKGDQTANGSVNLTMSNNELQGSIVGLGSAAYTDADAYATAAQGAKADSALQTLYVRDHSTDGDDLDGYLFEEDGGDTDYADSHKILRICTDISDANEETTAFADAKAVKEYTDAREAAANAYTDSALTWVEFN